MIPQTPESLGDRAFTTFAEREYRNDEEFTARDLQIAYRAWVGAQLAATHPTMADALAAGDGTLHGAIDYWQQRALAAEAQLAEARAEERERCAKVCEALCWAIDNGGNKYRRDGTASQCVAAIRASGAEG